MKKSIFNLDIFFTLLIIIVSANRSNYHWAIVIYITYNTNDNNIRVTGSHKKSSICAYDNVVCIL